MEIAGKNGVRFEAAEADLLRGLVDELRGLLTEEDTSDAVTQRLFPDAYDDAEDARAFRALVEDDLRSGKVRALETVRASLGDGGDARVSLEDDSVGSWLTALTDLRLAIGTRLGVTEETMSADMQPGTEVAPALVVLHWLGWVQESMLEVLG